MKNTGYFISQALKNIFRNTFMSLASVFTTSSCLIILGLSAAVILNANNIIEQIKSQCEIQLFLSADASQQQVTDTYNAIMNIENVKSAELFTKEDMLKFAMEDMFSGYEYELSGFEEDNPFSDSYKISLADISKTNETLRQLEKIENTDHIMNNQEIIDNILSVSSFVKKSGIILMILLFSLSMVIISNTVKITVFNRRMEINIMKYIGASDNFIKTPFIIEGAVLGTASAVISFGISAGIYIEVYRFFSEPNIFTLIPFNNFSMTLAAAFLISGLFINICGVSFAIKKHLDV